MAVAESAWNSLSRQLRRRTLDLHNRCGSGHIGCSLSCIELLVAALVAERRSGEAFILSKGHAALALYVCLNHLGEISDTDLSTVYQDDTRLPAHPAALHFPSIPFALGSLGHGLPIAAGIAKADQLQDDSRCTFVLMSDGETNAGTTWEACHFAVRHRLDRLMVLIDHNGLQGFGRVDDVLGDTADPAKFEAIGFEVVRQDGHDAAALVTTLARLRESRDGRPKMVVAATRKGHGVSFMEDRLEWHYLPLTAEQYQRAKADLDA